MTVLASILFTVAAAAVYALCWARTSHDRRNKGVLYVLVWVVLVTPGAAVKLSNNSILMTGSLFASAALFGVIGRFRLDRILEYVDGSLGSPSQTIDSPASATLDTAPTAAAPPDGDDAEGVTAGASLNMRSLSLSEEAVLRSPFGYSCTELRDGPSVPRQAVGRRTSSVAPSGSNGMITDMRAGIDSATADYQVAAHEEIVDKAMMHIEIEDPVGGGSSVSIMWPSNGMAVVTIGKQWSTELGLDQAGRAELTALVSAVLAHGATEHVHERGAAITFPKPEDGHWRYSTARGFRRGKLIETIEYPSFSRMAPRRFWGHVTVLEIVEGASTGRVSAVAVPVDRAPAFAVWLGCPYRPPWLS